MRVALDAGMLIWNWVSVCLLFVFWVFRIPQICISQAALSHDTKFPWFGMFFGRYPDSTSDGHCASTILDPIHQQATFWILFIVSMSRSGHRHQTGRCQTCTVRRRPCLSWILARERQLWVFMHHNERCGVPELAYQNDNWFNDVWQKDRNGQQWARCPRRRCHYRSTSIFGYS